MTYAPAIGQWCVEHDRTALKCSELALEDFGLPAFTNCEWVEYGNHECIEHIRPAPECLAAGTPCDAWWRPRG